jgi:glycosyltransferase 2 family protein
MRPGVRVALQLTVSASLVAYLVWKIDIGQTADEIASSNPLYVLAAVAIYVLTLVPMAWRWQVLLASKGVHEPLGWLTRLYLIGYAASQVLPTGVGGDAVRIVEHVRRRPNVKGETAGAVLMERVVGSAGILIVVAIGLALAVGRYDNLGPFIWVEVACVILLLAFGLVLFSRRANSFLQEHVFPRGRAIRLHRPLSAVWTALHGYRSQKRALALALAATIGVQFVRMLAIWLCGEAVGVDVSPLVYVILGPLLFLVTMIPVTVNGLGVRESFFVFFLDRFGVPADSAFAAGFLFFAVTIATALPGGLILAWRSLRGGYTWASRRESAAISDGPS